VLVSFFLDRLTVALRSSFAKDTVITVTKMVMNDIKARGSLCDDIYKSKIPCINPIS
jgi:hypothetical protein